MLLETDPTAIVNRVGMKGSDGTIAGGTFLPNPSPHGIRGVAVGTESSAPGATGAESSAPGYADQSFNTMFARARDQTAGWLLK